MLERAGDTIVAVGSAPGRSSLAVVRLSGPRAVSRVAELSGESGAELLRAPGASERAASLRLEGLELPARAAVWRAPRSYTREDVVELVLPGSLPLLSLVLRAIVTGPGARESGVRWAAPGELTLRAFQNGRIDLTQAESVAALIGATGEEEARASQRALRGELRDSIERIAAGVVEALALIEAALDFPDEDLPEVSEGALLRLVQNCIEQIEALRRSAALRSPRDGTLRVVLAGFPNAGKSSLLNAILGRRAALTSCVPGTTRDPVRGVTVRSGRRIEWIDVAGSLDGQFRSFGGEAPEEQPIWDAVRRLTRVEIDASDLVLWVVDPSEGLAESIEAFRGLDARAKRFVVQKGDLPSAPGAAALAARELGPADSPIVVSARVHTGIDAMVETVLASALAPPASGSAPVPRFLVSAHQESRLVETLEALGRAGAALRASSGLELAALDLREASTSLDALRGLSSREAVLSLVFSRFCLGK